MLKAEVSSKSSIGKAAAYTLGHWQGLTAFLDDGRIEVDSNIVERSIKPVCLTRKNALFAGSKRAGESWAILASLVNTAKLNGIDPELWLANVLEWIVSGTIPINRLDTLLPWTWKSEREALRHKIRLRVARQMDQRHEHLPAPSLALTHVILDDRIAAGETMLGPEPLKYPLGRVALLAKHYLVSLKPPVSKRPNSMPSIPTYGSQIP